MQRRVQTCPSMLSFVPSSSSLIGGYASVGFVHPFLHVNDTQHSTRPFTSQRRRRRNVVRLRCVCVLTLWGPQACCYHRVPRDGRVRTEYCERDATLTCGLPPQSSGTNAIAHACGRICTWWDTYIKPRAC